MAEDRASGAGAVAGGAAALTGADSNQVIEYEVWSPSTTRALQPAIRLDFAQAAGAGSVSDAASSFSMLDLPPYQLVVGGLALGALAGAAGGGGGGSGSTEYFVWKEGNLTITTPGGTVVTVDASTSGEGRVLTLIGASSVNVNGVRGSNRIDASMLTGELSVGIADDGAATRIEVMTGSGRTALNSGDGRDLLTIDAARLSGSSALSINGRASLIQVTWLATGLDASLLAAGELEVTTSAGAAAPRSLAIRTGAGPVSIAGQAGDTIILDAEALADNVTLRSGGAASFQISNLMGDLDNAATGSVSATLDHDPVPGAVIDARIRSSTAITVANGGFDGNDTIILEGTGAFTVTGLVASLDATTATSALSVTTGNATPPQNRIAIKVGPAAASVTGTSADDTVAIDATLVPDGTALQLKGASAFSVSGLQGDVTADQASGNLSVSTPDAGDQSVSVRLGAAGGQVRASSPKDLIAIDASAMARTSTLTIGGATFDGGSSGAVTVTGLSGALRNEGTGGVSVALVKAAGGGATTPLVTSGTVTVIDGGTLAGLDTIRVAGAGSFTLNGVAANVDGSGINGIGPVVVSLATSSDALNLNLGAGGNDTVIVNGRTTLATMIEVETLNVAQGGNISAASITSAATAPASGRVTGTSIDFGDQSATLVISAAQHDDVRTLLLTGQADSGAQTLQMASGTTIAQTIPYIDVYRLSAAGADVQVTINGAPVMVRNDAQQQNTNATGQSVLGLGIFGSSASDVLRTASVDVIRGGLTIDLSADALAPSADYLFVKNAVIGNDAFSGDDANAGLGGRVTVFSSGPTIYANFPTLGGTVNHWETIRDGAASDPLNVAAGIRAATVNGFDLANDKVVYLEASSDVAIGSHVTVTQTNPPGFAPSRNSVIEIESGFIDALAGSKPGVANVGADPRALDRIATLLAELPAFDDDNGNPCYVVVYDYTPQAEGVKADAWLYAALATQDDGFDFADGQGAASERDTDTLELIAIFKGIGVNAFASGNFV